MQELKDKDLLIEEAGINLNLHGWDGTCFPDGRIILNRARKGKKLRLALNEQNNFQR